MIPGARFTSSSSSLCESPSNNLPPISRLSSSGNCILFSFNFFSNLPAIRKKLLAFFLSFFRGKGNRRCSIRNVLSSRATRLVRMGIDSGRNHRLIYRLLLGSLSAYSSTIIIIIIILIFFSPCVCRLLERDRNVPDRSVFLSMIVGRAGRTGHKFLS